MVNGIPLEAAMIDAMASAICDRRNAPDWPCNGLDFDVEMARVALNAIRPYLEYMRRVALRDAERAAERNQDAAGAIHTLIEKDNAQ